MAHNRVPISFVGAMSALGQKQTCAAQKVMSALPPKADMCSALGDVRFVPIADICCRAVPQPPLMQGRNAMGFQCLDDAVKDQSDTHCGDEEADDAGNGIDPHRPQFF